MAWMDWAMSGFLALQLRDVGRRFLPPPPNLKSRMIPEVGAGATKLFSNPSLGWARSRRLVQRPWSSVFADVVAVFGILFFVAFVGPNACRRCHGRSRHHRHVFGVMVTVVVVVICRRCLCFVVVVRVGVLSSS